jgi:glycosyltransferase involved in cell wall biosynthesis
VRIAHVTATFPPYHGGTGNVAFHHARVLSRRGHAVTVFTAAPAGGAAATAEGPGFPVAYLPVRWRLGNAPYTPDLGRALEGFELIHLHWPYIFGAEMALAAARRQRVPLVVTYHNDLLAPGWRGAAFAAYRHLSQGRVLRAADQVVATSLDYARASHLRRLAAQGAVVAVPNGVDLERFRPKAAPDPAARARWGVPPGAPLVLFVGALDRAHWFKGVPLLLQAVARLPEAHVVVAGDGDLRSGLQAEGARLLGPRAHFLGRVADADLPGLYGAADVTVLPSTTRGEAFGMVLVESMACATPVVASDLPGVRSVVSHGEDGLLVPPGQTAALAEALAGLLDDPGLRRRMGARGRAKVQARYSWEAVADGLEGVYAAAARGLTAGRVRRGWAGGPAGGVA